MFLLNCFVILHKILEQHVKSSPLSFEEVIILVSITFFHVQLMTLFRLILEFYVIK